MSRITVFVGPSISRTTVQEIVPDALLLPPAEQGDVHFARHQLGSDVIAMIDGVHSQRLPTWHCELLDVLADGARILGAASMGALRAVECAPWGAEPIGEIAEWYASGYIDGDDEVCLAHGDESTGWKQFSIPMVNVRATLKAVPSIMLSAIRKEEIIEVAKGIFYPERTWRRIADACELRDFDLEEYEVDLKQADAMALCYLLADLPPQRSRSGKSGTWTPGIPGSSRPTTRRSFTTGRSTVCMKLPRTRRSLTAYRWRDGSRWNFARWRALRRGRDSNPTRMNRCSTCDRRRWRN